MFKEEKGFTLVEVLVVVAIIAILGALAVPSYQEYLRKSRRADAFAAIQQVAAQQERYFSTQRSYASLADPFTSTATLPSPAGYYVIRVVADNTARSYDITATPVAGKPQEKDLKCTSLSMSNNGRKYSTGTYDTAGNGIQCWR